MILNLTFQKDTIRNTNIPNRVSHMSDFKKEESTWENLVGGTFLIEMDIVGGCRVTSGVQSAQWM